MSEIMQSQSEFAKAQHERPEYVTEDHLQFLDELRKSGDTNMFGATPYVKAEFPELSSPQASDILSYWMKSFSERKAAKVS